MFLGVHNPEKFDQTFRIFSTSASTKESVRPTKLTRPICTFALVVLGYSEQESWLRLSRKRSRQTRHITET